MPGTKEEVVSRKTLPKPSRSFVGKKVKIGEQLYRVRLKRRLTQFDVGEKKEYIWVKVK